MWFIDFTTRKYNIHNQIENWVTVKILYVLLVTNDTKLMLNINMAKRTRKRYELIISWWSYPAGTVWGNTNCSFT